MMLQELQQSMAAYLREMGTAESLPEISPVHPVDECLNIYRNHYLVSLGDAITATFPVTRDFLGEQLFQTKVRSYILANPPVSGCLAEYGQDFPSWLSHEIADGDGVSDVAALEWTLERVGMSPLPKPFPFQLLAELSSDQYENVRFNVAAAVRLFSSNWDVVSLYDHIKNNDVSNMDGSLAFKQCRWLIYRKPDGVGVYPIDIFFSTVISICQSGQPLSILGDQLSSEHFQAIFFMVEKGIIDSFDML